MLDDERGERAIHAAKIRNERRLYALAQQLADAGYQDGDTEAVMLKVTAYERRDGSVIPGKTRPELLSAERVLKSIEDAEATLEHLRER